MRISRTSTWSLGFAICGMLIGGSTNANANLVTDPGFDLPNDTHLFSPYWVLTGSAGLTTAAGSGAAFVNCNHPGDIAPCNFNASGSVSQTLNTTIGDTYSVDFWLTDNGGDVAFGTNGNVSVAFGNTTGFVTTTAFPDPSIFFREFSFSATATGSTSAFTFASQALTGGTFFITAVSVTDLTSGAPPPPSAPEPSTFFTAAGLLIAAVLLRKRRAAL